MIRKLVVLILFALACAAWPAKAQQANLFCFSSSPPTWQPCSAGLPLNVTGGVAWANTNKVIPWDGTTNITVKPASTASIATDTSTVVQLNPNSPGIIPPGQTTKSASVPVVFPVDTNAAATYGLDVSGYVAYATPTDLYCINGSASKIVRISEMNIRVQSTAGALQTVQFIKRSTANTGGTPTSQTAIPYYSANAAATATVTSYGSAPSLGTAVGTLRIVQGTSGTLTAAAINLAMRNNFLNATLVSSNQYVTLNGVAEGLCINYGGAALTSGFTAIIGAEWEESAN